MKRRSPTQIITLLSTLTLLVKNVESHTNKLIEQRELLGSAASTTTSVWINEFHYDNIGSDTGEFIEVGCNSTIDLTGYKVVRYNGNNGASYGTDILSGVCAPPSQFIVIDYPSNGLQNGAPDGIALVDATDQVIEFISYEGSFVATDGVAVGVTSVDIGISETSSTAAGTSLQLTGTGCNKSDFTWIKDVSETKLSTNQGQTISCVSNNS